MSHPRHSFSPSDEAPEFAATIIDDPDYRPIFDATFEAEDAVAEESTIEPDSLAHKSHSTARPGSIDDLFLSDAVLAQHQPPASTGALGYHGVRSGAIALNGSNDPASEPAQINGAVLHPNELSIYDPDSGQHDPAARVGDRRAPPNPSHVAAAEVEMALTGMGFRSPRVYYTAPPDLSESSRLRRANASQLPTQIRGVAACLVRMGDVTESAALSALEDSKARSRSFLSSVIESKCVTSRRALISLMSVSHMAGVDLDSVNAASIPQEHMDRASLMRHEALVLGVRGRNLYIATSDPFNDSVVDELTLTSGLRVFMVLADHTQLLQALGKSPEGAVTKAIVPPNQGDIVFDMEDEAPPEDTEVNDAVGDAPVVRFLQRMLGDAITMRASDLHFEPYEESYRVRFRIDGELREITSAPPAIKNRLAARIKVISRLDISEKRIPQDGRVKLKFHGQSIDFRVSTLPTLYGEKIVIRILDSSTAKLGIDALGYEPMERSRLLDAISRPYGMILVTGPTGSGKTVSLYACLNLLNKPGVNISTVEDPAEINMPGVNQVSVNDRAGLTFAAALKSFLRQDPDIIMVGEIRDLETAEIAIKASQTGHLVLSTLHTNDAPSTLTRLLNMGVAPFNIASSVLLITAQRLARKLCEACKAPGDYPRSSLLAAGFSPEELDGSWRPYKPVGCRLCTAGYKGRTGVYQVMPITDSIQRLILNKGSSLDLAEQSRSEGVLTLREAGLAKVRAGVTSVEEILASTNL